MGAEDPANQGPTCTLPCHTLSHLLLLSKGRRGQRIRPHPQPNTDTMGLPPTARAGPFYSTSSLSLRQPLWGQPGLWGSGTTAHRSRVGKTGAPSAADWISWPNFLYFSKLTV